MDRAMAHEYHRLPAHGEQIAWDPPWQPQNGFLYSDGPDLTNSQRLILTAGSVVLASLAVIGLMALPVGLILVAVVAFVGIPGLSAIAGIELLDMGSSYPHRGHCVSSRVFCTRSSTRPCAGPSRTKRLTGSRRGERGRTIAFALGYTPVS